MKSEFIGPIVLIIFFSSFIYLQSNQKFSIEKNSEPTAREEKLHSFKLKEVSKELAIIFEHKKYNVHPKLYHLNDWFNSLGSSVSATDYDNDGNVDLFFCNGKLGSENKLFRNLGNGKFEDVSKKVNLNFFNTKESVCVRPIFFDFNNDKLKDLFVSTHYCPKLFKQKLDGTFEDITKKAGLGKYCIGGTASNILDYDKDGFIDVFLAGYGPSFNVFEPKTTKVLHNSNTNATNSGETILLKNRGDGSFEDVYEKTNMGKNGWALAVGIHDFNLDNYPDVWVASDYGPSKLYLNNTDGTFSNESSRLAHDYARSGMGVEVADVFHTNDWYVYVSQNYNPFDKIAGNQLYQFNKYTKIEDLAYGRNVSKCGWSWGSKFVDLNNDGFEDLVVANGFISGDPKKEYWYHIGELNAAGPDVLSDAKNWKPINGYTFGGHQKNCLFVNNGREFINISKSSNFSSKAFDSRGVAKVDFDNNGSLDIVVTNQGEKPFVFKNIISNQNKWIGFKLYGKDQNYFAIGAKIKLTLKNGKVFVKQMYDANGFSAQSDSRIHFGLGKREIKEIDILWPWGKEQKIKKFVYNKYNEIKFDKSL